MGAGVGLSQTGGAAITVLPNFAAFPDPTTVADQFFWASSSQGTAWLPFSLGGTYYNSGLYYSNGVTWEFLKVPYQATQAIVDAGVNNDQFVTALTNKNSTQWNLYQLLSEKNKSNGYPGLFGFDIMVLGGGGTIINQLTTSSTTNQIWTLPDKTGTIALMSDVYDATLIGC